MGVLHLEFCFGRSILPIGYNKANDKKNHNLLNQTKKLQAA